jgi:hypothetical protein
MSGTRQRDHVTAIAATKPAQALELARRIEDPWFRCQALSIAAVHARDRRVRTRAIDEAFAAANELDEPNRVVTVSAWAIKALLVVGDDARRVSAETGRLLQTIAAESSPVRRADGLRWLLGAVSTARREVAVSVAAAFGAACLTPLRSGRRNQKGDSLLEACLPAIARLDPRLADGFLRELPAARSERAARAIAMLSDAALAEVIPWPHLGA